MSVETLENYSIRVFVNHFYRQTIVQISTPNCKTSNQAFSARITTKQAQIGVWGVRFKQRFKSSELRARNTYDIQVVTALAMKIMGARDV